MARTRVHLVGVAGVGMSALAQCLLDGGAVVSGSDRECDRGASPDNVRKLTGQGLSLHPQDGSGIDPKTTAVVVSTAVEDDNPELRKADALGVPVRHRAELLAEVTAGRELIVVTGTSGKSTVTGMIGHVLERVGKDPGVVNGAEVLNWVTPERLGSVRKGNGAWVVEGDESDRSVLQFNPDWGIVTNVSRDHFGLEETRRLFREFAGRTKRGVVSPVKDEDLYAEFSPRVDAAGVGFDRRGVEIRVPLWGEHNAANAYVCTMACEMMGIPPAAVRDALADFRGLRRRLERLGEARGIAVIDDYAHNPSKIGAAWQAVGGHCGRIHAVWRPHGYGPLRKMMDDLVETFAELCGDGGRLAVLPVYDAGGTADRSIGSEALVDALIRRGSSPTLVRNGDETVAWALDEVRAGDAVLVMGARDPGLPALGHRILEAIRTRIQPAG